MIRQEIGLNEPEREKWLDPVQRNGQEQTS